MWFIHSVKKKKGVCCSSRCFTGHVTRMTSTCTDNNIRCQREHFLLLSAPQAVGKVCADADPVSGFLFNFSAPISPQLPPSSLLCSFGEKKEENIKENPVHQIWVSVGPAGPQTDRQTGPNPHRVLPFCLLSAAANKAKENWLSTSNELDKWQLRGRRLSLSFPFKYQLDAIKSISAAQITAKRAPNCNKQFTHQTRT